MSLRLFVYSIGLLVGMCSACTFDTKLVTDSATNPVETITDSATWLVQQAVQAQGADHIDSSTIVFTFRDRQYRAERQGSDYTYYRTQAIDGREVIDRLDVTAGLSRTIDGESVELSAKDSTAYAGSVNSVIYFALLPYNLQDAAVQPTYLGQTAIDGTTYHKLQVTFGEEGGGEDFEDEYVYWFRTDNFDLDYLAYNFLVDKGGARFRKAYKERRVDGVRFVDYVNYKPTTDNRAVITFDSLYTAGGLDTLSVIELEDITVE